MISGLAVTDIHWKGIGLLAPELCLVVVSLIVLVQDLVQKGRDCWKIGAVSLIGLGITALLLLQGRGTHDTAFGLVQIDDFGNFFKLFTVGSLAVVMFFVMQDRREKKHDIGEYFFLLLGAAVGIFFMVGTNNLLLLMLGLELLSLASYALAGFHKGEKRSAEAAMKYVVFGGLSAGVMLFGISLLYGATGTLDLAVMAGIPGAEGEGLTRSLGVAITEAPGLVAIAMVMILGGFAFKLSVAPFHFWAPDVYEGAPMPVTTFLAVGSKAAGFGALLRFIAVLFVSPSGQAAVAEYGVQLGQLLGLMAAATMTLGNLAALRQDSVKRMLAYSAVAHAGYVLVGVAAMNVAGFEAAMFYLAAYYFMNLGAFGFMLYFAGVTGQETFASLRGMGRKCPLMAVPMVVFLVSLTGLPPTIGFAGKLALIRAGMGADLGWLVMVLVANSVVSLYYYMRVIKELFLKEAPEGEAPAPQKPLAIFLVAMASLTVIFGLWFTPLMQWANDSMDLITGL
ncbi:MAG: NADH-quinone oxidoreductase subunit N [Planctomycetota bacterium]|jgi:NADH-quinone oxidoreductase subunit N